MKATKRKPRCPAKREPAWASNADKLMTTALVLVQGAINAVEAGTKPKQRCRRPDWVKGLLITLNTTEDYLGQFHDDLKEARARMVEAGR